MSKISGKGIKFITEAMKKWKVELIAGGKTLTEVEIQRGIFQGDALLRLLFLIAMMLLNYILRKSTGGYKFTKSPEKSNHLMNMDNISLQKKTKTKNNPKTKITKYKKKQKKQTGDSNIDNMDIHPGHRNGILQVEMSHAYIKRKNW